jgi:WD40-like Beta Propeller Repeat
MTERERDETFDLQLQDFLAWQASDIAGAPTAPDVAARISSHLGATTTALRLASGLMWLVLGILLIATLLSLGMIGARLLLPRPISGPTNGWIAFSTQPGFPEAMHECCGSGGDIYLVREGIEPRLIVSRGSANTSNVCPAFSPDGLTLVYGHRDGASRALILLAVHADGSVSETARLDVPGGSNVPCPRWSTDGNRLAYLDGLSRDGVPLGQPASVVVRGLDGSTVVPGPTDPNLDDLSRTSSFVDSDTPLKSPSGDWAVLADSRGVIIERPDGSDARVLLTPEGFGALVSCCPGSLTPYSIPAWSPDGRFVLAMGDVGGPGFTLAAISVDSPAQSIVLAHDVAVNSASNWPVRGDSSWQPVFEGSTP